MNCENKKPPTLIMMKVAYFLVLVPLPVLAGPPVAFNGWSASNGTIAAGCPSGFTCEVVGSSPGFLQRSITSSALGGGTYVQTIVTGSTASGTPLAGLSFTDEGFVRAAGGGLGTGSEIPPGSTQGAISLTGIADRQAIKLQNTTSNATQSFDYLAMIKTGWAADPGVPNVDIRQTISELSNTGKKFDATTLIQSNNDKNGMQTGTRLNYDTVFTQPVGADQRGGDGDSKGGSSFRDGQAVSIRQVGGDMLTSSGSAILTNGQGITWQAGDTVGTMWGGQLMRNAGECKLESRPRGRCELAQGFQSLDNKSDSTEISRYFQFGAAGPFTWWDNPFGPRPVMPNVLTGDTNGND